MNLTLPHIQAAAELLKRRLGASPLVTVNRWRTVGDAQIVVKAESLMPTGSFKIRGATWRVSTLTAEERSRGVVAYSTGNHAQAVAKAAADAGIKATIVMSPDVPLAKIDATKAWGAFVVMADSTSHARRILAESLAEEHGYVLVPPYDDMEVMAGQASIGVELLAQLADKPPGAVFVPIGGGGLLAGVAAAIKQLAPEVKVIGVEPELENDAYRSFHEGRLSSMKAPSESVADAIKVQSLGNLTFPLIRQYVDDIVTVSESDIMSACLRYYKEAHLVVEPGGAVSLAAAFCDQYKFPSDTPVVVLACGGNITLERLTQLQMNLAQRSNAT
ncbi:threonine/serine dehydratase [Undibacterium sp. TS12]|uniref:threonine ammonia-lyase n=1 Tax=Undibacterium sp. TS12 TaxID=2908202 RepID=UPI001F4C6BD7|nr:threonine/serine dehydratase [Undibacterium sp. TS12]MCH8620250.1 threonine/serine dehydratase [Undibacterium sp. TS12]